MGWFAHLALFDMRRRIARAGFDTEMRCQVGQRVDQCVLQIATHGSQRRDVQNSQSVTRLIQQISQRTAIGGPRLARPCGDLHQTGFTAQPSVPGLHLKCLRLPSLLFEPILDLREAGAHPYSSNSACASCRVLASLAGLS